MAQRGIMSFFGKTDTKSPSSSRSKQHTPKKRTAEKDTPKRMGERKGTDGPILDSADSPVFKGKLRKRKRVIFDSDDDGEEESEGGVEVKDSAVDKQGGDGEGEKETDLKEGGETIENDGKGEPMVEDDKNVETGEERMENGVEDGTASALTAVQNSSSSSTNPPSTSLPSPLANSELLKTPPRRKTARKHTGRVSLTSSEVTSSSSQTGLTKTDDTNATKSPPTKKQKTANYGIKEEGGICDPTCSDGETRVGREEIKERAEGGTETVQQDADPVTDKVDKEEENGVTEPLIKPEDEVGDEAMEVGGEKEGQRIQEQVKEKKKTPRRVGKKGSATPQSGKKKAIHPFFTSCTPKRSTGEPQASAPVAKNEESAAQSPSLGQKASGSKTSGSYDPTRRDYHPVDHACWQKGEKVPYLAITKTFERIEEESKRLKIIAILTNFFRSVIALSPDELVKCVYLCLNKLAPAYEGMELGIGESLLIKAIAGATGRSVGKIKNDVVKKGDLGIVAETSRSNQRMMFAPPKLTVSGVFAKLKDIATMSGSASMSKKVEIIKSMFVACQQSEARYLIRSLGGKLRIGLAEQSVLVAIGHAVVYTPPGQDWPLGVVDGSSTASSSELFHKSLDEAVLTIKTCYCEHPNYDRLISSLLLHGIAELPAHCRLTPGVPLKPMLAHPTKGTQEVLRRFEDAAFTCEWKYDGERAQIHVLEGGEVKIYSRNSENNTSKYPDIISRMPKVLKESVRSCVIDAEAVAWDTEKGEILPFQVLSTRKRKDANVSDIKVQVCVFAFDLLYLNDKSLVREALKTRRELLKSSFNEIQGEFLFAKSMDGTNVEEIQEFMEESIRGNCEGLMVKTLEKDATYEIAKRSHNWLKLKKDYLEGVGDTLDLVVVGGFHGTGKRTGKYGGFLLACYDEDSEEFQVICKIGTGFKDDQLEQHTDFFKDHLLEGPKPYFRYNEGTQPDQWFDSVQVWEIKAADLSISPVYTAAAGIVDAEKGISLRFPRFLRIREDKSPEQATSSTQVAEMYRSQVNSIKANTATTDNANDDIY